MNLFIFSYISTQFLYIESMRTKISHAAILPLPRPILNRYLWVASSITIPILSLVVYRCETHSFLSQYINPSFISELSAFQQQLVSTPRMFVEMVFLFLFSTVCFIGCFYRRIYSVLMFMFFILIGMSVQYYLPLVTQKTDNLTTFVQSRLSSLSHSHK